MLKLSLKSEGDTLLCILKSACIQSHACLDILETKMIRKNYALFQVTNKAQSVLLFLGVLTFVISLDIQFWRSRKTLEGLSVRSVFFNVFQSVVVLLYVMDNETNTVIVISCFVGLLIEIWKINKAVDIKVIYCCLNFVVWIKTFIKYCLVGVLLVLCVCDVNIICQEYHCVCLGQPPLCYVNLLLFSKETYGINSNVNFQLLRSIL